jgi:predicted aspartyl protease
VKFGYANEYVPPAPILEIRLALPGESFAQGSLRALLDTGADATVVPLRHIQPLGAPIDDRKYLRTPWGERRTVYTYLLDVEVAGLRLPSIEVVGDDTGDEAIVGRDVLNRLRITLNGPAGSLEVTG